ncbi:glycoside hydrolase family 26 protein [Actinoplanes sp. CA-030573]|uniref:glycoside hydrolase family 26 protein n=1 Tax=Actinoplanes sp. CA-030573 TaxID=3239898 RepID=UPI003D8C86BE
MSRILKMALAVVVSIGVLGSSSSFGAAARPVTASFLFGAAVDDLRTSRQRLPALEAELGRPVDIASTYVDWSYVFPGPTEKWMAAGGKRQVLISWEPWKIRFRDVAAGRQDSYLAAVAKAMRAYPYDVYVRPWPELNGNWSTWQPTPAGDKRDGGTPTEFVAAWRHVVSFFRDRGVRNLKFVFNVDASDLPSNTRVPAIWPGSAYVDVLGLDGFNWNEGGWRSFRQIFAPMYATVTGLDPRLPVWVTEFGCAPGPDRPAWLSAMMTTRAFPRLRAVVYFDVRSRLDWRLGAADRRAIRPHLRGR